MTALADGSFAVLLKPPRGGRHRERRVTASPASIGTPASIPWWTTAATRMVSSEPDRSERRRRVQRSVTQQIGTPVLG